MKNNTAFEMGQAGDDNSRPDGNAIMGATKQEESDASIFSFLRDGTKTCCLDPDESLRLETQGRVVWRPLPCTEQISPFVFVRLHDMIRRGQIGTLLVDPPGEHALHCIHADLAAFIQEFAFLLTDDSRELD